jgi:hypothetical protein
MRIVSWLSLFLSLAALALALALATPAQAQSLNDQLILGGDAIFQGRVRSAVITAAINIASDGLTTPNINAERHRQVTDIMSSPDTWKIRFSYAIATQATVIGPATASGTVVLTSMPSGNVDTQQALVSDAVINTAVAAVFNSFFGGQ